MLRRSAAAGCLTGLAALWLTTVALAAPRIDNLSLRGLQAGGITTLVIDGAELGPQTKIVFSAPHAKHAIKDGATPQRLEVEFTIDGQCESGIYLLRVASASGISEAVALGIDNLAQIPFAPQAAALNVAMSGALSGSTVLTTSFEGKQGQEVLVEVESRRLGAKLNPVVHIYDSRHTQLAFGQRIASIADDARAGVTLPADGTYSVELHDGLFRGEAPGFFRLKIGQFRYADLAFPLAVERGAAATFEFAATNLPAEARASATFGLAEGLAQDFLPAPWPAGVAMLSGSRPTVIVSDHTEVLEAATAEKPQEVGKPPLAINGRIDAAGQQDRFRLAVAPGQQLKFDVLARRAGSSLDGVLSIQNEQGAELAGNDDRPGTSDPGLDFKVPDGTSAVIVALRDLRGQGEADYLYRISVVEAGAPNFSLSFDADRIQIPRDGAALARVKVNRAGYGGPIKLNFPNLPAGVSVTGDEIPERASEALVTLFASGIEPAQALLRATGTGQGMLRTVSLPETTTVKHQPWLGDQLAVAVTTAAPLVLAWEPFESDAKLTLGTSRPTKVSVKRAEGVKGAVRLTLLTTQPTPRKTIKENNQNREVDDVERALRFAAPPMIAGDAGEAMASILVPADLPQIAYDLAIQAELLGEDNKTVVASTVVPARRLATALPLSLELATDAVAARAGTGPTGKVIGTIKRAAGFSLPVNVTLTGLPQGLSAPTVTLTGDQAQFAFPLAFAFGTPAGELKDVKVSATSLANPKDPKSVFNAGQVPLAVVVVPGAKPPEPPAAGKK